MRLGHDTEPVERPHGGGQAILIDRKRGLSGRWVRAAQGRAGAGVLTPRAASPTRLGRGGNLLAGIDCAG